MSQISTSTMAYPTTTASIGGPNGCGSGLKTNGRMKWLNRWSWIYENYRENFNKNSMV